MGRNKYSVSTLCLKKYCFCRKKIMSRQLVPKNKSAALQSEKLRKKNHSPHPPYVKWMFPKANIKCFEKRNQVVVKKTKTKTKIIGTLLHYLEY